MRHLIAIALLPALLPTLAAAACLEDGKPIAGELREVKTRDLKGKLITTLHVVLPVATCAKVDDTGTSPIMITGVRSVEFVPKGTVGREQARQLIGAKVEIKGKLGIPADGSGSADVVALKSEVLTVDRKSIASADEPGVDAADEPAVPTAEDANRVAEAPADEDAAAVPDATNADQRPIAERADLPERLTRFVTDYYLGSSPLSSEQLRALYATRVEYFGGRKVSVERVVADKLSYYRRWTDRRFRLVDGTLDINRDRRQPSLFHVSFEYDFRISGPGRRSSGRGFGLITLDLGTSDAHIVRETGEVLQSQ